MEKKERKQWAKSEDNRPSFFLSLSFSNILAPLVIACNIRMEDNNWGRATKQRLTTTYNPALQQNFTASQLHNQFDLMVRVVSVAVAGVEVVFACN